MSANPHHHKLPTTLLILLSILAIFPTVGCETNNSNLTNKGLALSANAISKPTRREIVKPVKMRALPGKLDTVPVFNSNSPEWIKTEGILLSTFSRNGKKYPAAHLNFPFRGRFDIFAHHYARNRQDLRTLYLGLMLHNPSNKPVTVNVLQAASYLSPDGSFTTLPPYLENPNGLVFVGPGDRAVTDVMRGVRQSDFPSKLVIPPRQSRMLLNHPIPMVNWGRASNGRSSFMRLRSSGTVYVASLAMFAKKNSDGTERAPTLREWQVLLKRGKLAGPRDKAPTSPNRSRGKLIYGRVAGVSRGSRWKARLVDKQKSQNLTIPQRGKAISYPLATLRAGRLGTNQIQTAKMLVRYRDTAYEAHGNYGVEYNLNLPLFNPNKQTRTVNLTIETPIKEDKLSKRGLRFRQGSSTFPFFRGTVRLRYTNEWGQPTTRYVHLWHGTGQVLEPLLQLKIPAKSRRSVQVDLIYPPDSTPPQVLTVRTL